MANYGEGLYGAGLYGLPQLSVYMPDVLVEVAFNAGFGTPDAERVWTDVSEWVELDQTIGITYGRANERGDADANGLTLTLDNSDGRFTPERAGSPYFPNVKLGRPIRVTAVPVDGGSSVRFLGYVNKWPLSWAHGVGSKATVKYRV